MIIVEGIDGTGKSSLVDFLVAKGFARYHFDYDRQTEDIFSKYANLLSINEDLDRTVLDRSFISEMVYGPTVRGFCRLSKKEYIQLLNNYSDSGCILVYLQAPKQTLLNRRINDESDIAVITDYYDQLSAGYQANIDIAKKYLRTMVIDTDEVACKDIGRRLMDFIKLC
jgi:thymidylate kinase